MENITAFLIAALLGIASVTLFYRGWLGFLRILSALYLRIRSEIPKQELFVRLNAGFRDLLFNHLLLTFFFLSYLTELGSGATAPETGGYSLAILFSMMRVFRTVSRDVHELFETRALEAHELLKFPQITSSSKDPGPPDGNPDHSA